MAAKRGVEREAARQVQATRQKVDLERHRKAVAFFRADRRAWRRATEPRDPEAVERLHLYEKQRVLNTVVKGPARTTTIVNPNGEVTVRDGSFLELRPDIAQGFRDADGHQRPPTQDELKALAEEFVENVPPPAATHLPNVGGFVLTPQMLQLAEDCGWDRAEYERRLPELNAPPPPPPAPSPDPED